MHGEEQADDDAEEPEGIGLSGIETSGHVGMTPSSVSVGPAGDEAGCGEGGTESSQG